MSQEKQTAEENKGREIALTEYIKQKRTAEECFGFIDGYDAATLKLKEQAKEIEELTRSRDDVFHELEGYKEHNNQLAKEIERLKGEKQLAVKSLLTIKNTLKDLFT